MSLLKSIHNFVLRHFSKPIDETEDVITIPEEKGPRLNWNVDYFAQINVSELKPEDVIIFRISDQVELDQISLFKAKEALEKKAKLYGITNKVMVLYKVDMGIVSPGITHESPA